MLSEIERIVTEALHDERPAERLAELAAASADLSDDDRRRLAAIDADGFRLTALIVKKLRFERVLGGGAAIRARHDADPAEFLAAFRRYARAVRPVFESPEHEARAFAEFVAGETS